MEAEMQTPQREAEGGVEPPLVCNAHQVLEVAGSGCIQDVAERLENHDGYLRASDFSRGRQARRTEEPSLRRIISAPSLHAKPSSSARTPFTRPRLQEAQLASSHKVATRSSATAPKAQPKAEVTKEKSKVSHGHKRALSLEELQPRTGPPERSASGNLGSQKSAPKKLLQKLSFTMPQTQKKIGTAYPILAPMERRILAAVGEREWIKVDHQGSSSVFKRDKHAMTSELGIQIRDLRLLDPLMTSSYPSCILCREKALIVNLEYVKCIITTEYVLILDADQKAVKAFTEELQARLRENSQRREGEADARLLGMSETGLHTPFELRALEAALDEVCKHLESLCSDLEVLVRPMVGMTAAAKVTSDFLERLRRVKSKLVGQKLRVETLKEVMEKYLDDEDDLRAMHLSGKLRAQRLAVLRRLARRSSRERSSTLDRASVSDFGVCLDTTELVRESQEDAQLQLTQEAAQLESEREALEVEMLLEGHYMNLDSTWNKLTNISELIDDAEELMDLEMDTYRNNIIRMKVFLGACHLFAGTFWAITNIFGMNIGLLEDDLMGRTYQNFVKVSAISSGGLLLLMAALTIYLHQRRLAITAITC